MAYCNSGVSGKPRFGRRNWRLRRPTRAGESIRALERDSQRAGAEFIMGGSKNLTMTSTPPTSLSNRDAARRMGQVFTPPPIADWMTRWACALGPQRILDPALGRGVFVEAIEALIGTTPAAKSPRIDACELDHRMCAEFTATPRRVAVHCRQEDFLAAVFEEKFDAIIANPPYVRHHEMRRGPEVFTAFDRLCGRRISRTTNLYGLFLIKIWTLLAARGRAAVITPAEWLNADFGVALKAFLREENAIDAIVHFDHAANVFEGALTTAAITLLRRHRTDDEPVSLCTVDTSAELTDRTLDRAWRVQPADLNPSTKWTPLFPNAHQAADPNRPDVHETAGAATPTDPNSGRGREIGLPPLDGTGPARFIPDIYGADRERHSVAGASGWFPSQRYSEQQPSAVEPSLFDAIKPHPASSPRRAAHRSTLGEIARCMRGIATGANTFFALRESDRRRWDIDPRDLRRCITKAQQITSERLTDADVQRIVEADQRIYLLCPRDGLTAEVERYLEEGRRLGVDQRYLPSHRPVWYRPERREPAPILVSVFARGEFRFVLNEAGVLNLTAYHGIYPRKADGGGILALYDYLKRPAAQEALRAHRRIYGDGLLKLEPRDVEALPIPDELRRV